MLRNMSAMEKKKKMIERNDEAEYPSHIQSSKRYRRYIDRANRLTFICAVYTLFLKTMKNHVPFALSYFHLFSSAWNCCGSYFAHNCLWFHIFARPSMRMLWFTIYKFLYIIIYIDFCGFVDFPYFSQRFFFAHTSLVVWICIGRATYAPSSAT